MKNFIASIIESTVKQFKLPRKGISIILFVVLSAIILIDMYIYDNSIDFSGSPLRQLIYGIWIWSIFAFFAKCYNEYCDKKDIRQAEIEKRKTEQELEEKHKQDAKNKLNEYMECIDTCNIDECSILIKFYISNRTSIDITYEELSYVAVLNNKGLGFIGGRSCGVGAIAYVTPSGLKIIRAYYDRDKKKIFEFFKTLDKDDLKLLKEFDEYNDTEIFLSRNKKKAKNLVNKFLDGDFGHIWYDSERESLNITDLYLDFIKQYFMENSID